MNLTEAIGPQVVAMSAEQLKAKALAEQLLKLVLSLEKDGVTFTYGEKPLNQLENLIPWYNQRFTESANNTLGLKVTDKVWGTSTYGLQLVDAFGCCGKAYLWSFNLSVSCIAATLKLAIALTQYCGYSYLGLIHTAKSDEVAIAESVGFKVAVEFTNKRSKNLLKEMYIIL